MFKFDFDLSQDEMDEDLASQLAGSSQPDALKTSTISDENDQLTKAAFCEHQLADLFQALPGVISYSPLQIPGTGSTGDMHISKRDLYDARFQLIASGSGEGATAQDTPEDLDTDLQYVEAPSDLVPGVYEGGLKTWECSIDLAARVNLSVNAKAFAQKKLRTLELGCGTAMPSIVLLQKAFSSEPHPDRTVEIHIQDYNDLVFRLVTLPNIILAWYMSPASSSFISTYQPAESDADAEQEPLPPADPTAPGDLTLSPALLAAFQASLKEYGVSIRFFSGSWENFDLALTEQRYDIIITSETIYRTESLASLCDLMWRAYIGVGTNDDASDVRGLEDSTSQLSLKDTPSNSTSPICLVAAKLVYFGVGGGVSEFTRAIETGVPSSCSRQPGKVDTVWKKDEGVKRVILEVQW